MFDFFVLYCWVNVRIPLSISLFFGQMFCKKYAKHGAFLNFILRLQKIQEQINETPKIYVII
jgi:hypothetical protein